MFSDKVKTELQWMIIIIFQCGFCDFKQLYDRKCLILHFYIKDWKCYVEKKIKSGKNFFLPYFLILGRF